MKKDNQMADRLVRGVRNAKGSTVSKQPSKPAPRKSAPRKSAPGKPATGKTTTGKTATRDELHPERIWPD